VYASKLRMFGGGCWAGCVRRAATRRYAVALLMRAVPHLPPQLCDVPAAGGIRAAS
jgi:hypothetical protein